MNEIGRRQMMKSVVAAGGVASLAVWWRTDRAEGLQAGPGPYGDLQPANADGLMLPAGFTSRIVARTGQRVGNSSYVWHGAPDGGACFAKANGGWVYVSNSELDNKLGGAGAISFDADGSIANGYRILTGTTRNCAGGATQWATWLSCEENGGVGQVYECNPYGGAAGVVRPGLGRFNHEAAAIDPSTGTIYLTEDDPNGRLYRFVPTVRGDLSAGVLQAAVVTGSSVSWVAAVTTGPDRQANTAVFNGGEGAWVSRRVLYITTKGDNRIWALDLATQTISVFYDFAATPGAALRGVDNICGHTASGDLYVAEDGDNMEVCVIGAVNGETTVSPFVRVVGHASSEVTGPAFNPAGTRLYFSSQRGTDGNGVTYEVTGPFRTSAGPAPVVDTQAPAPPPGVTAVAADNDVTVTWQPATDLPDPGGVGVASYWVVRDWTTQWSVPAGGDLRYVDRGVAAGTHRYQVFAVDKGNRISAGSTSVSVVVGAAPVADTLAPNPPAGVAATLVNGNQVKVTWQAATDLPDPGGVGVASYWVVRDWVNQWLVPANGPLEFTDTTAPVGNRRYLVKAVDKGNRISAGSATVSIVVP